MLRKHKTNPQWLEIIQKNKTTGDKGQKNVELKLPNAFYETFPTKLILKTCIHNINTKTNTTSITYYEGFNKTQTSTNEIIKTANYHLK